MIDWNGDYASFLVHKEQQLAAEETANALFDKRLAQEEVWIRQGIKARRTRNEGRVRALKAMRAERAERRERQGKATITLETADKSGKQVMVVENASFAHPGGPALVKDFSMVLQRGDRKRALSELSALEARSANDEETLTALVDFYERMEEKDRALALLESQGRVTALVTQNVDGLHQAAGHRGVIDLHGRIDVVRCLACERRIPRELVQAELVERNPYFASLDALEAPDGDAVLDQKVRRPAGQRRLQVGVVLHGHARPQQPGAWLGTRFEAEPGVRIPRAPAP